MAGDGRIARARTRLRRGRHDEGADAEIELEEKKEADPAKSREGSDDASADADDGLGQLSLGDIDENRRESVARRLSALRERGPRQRQAEAGSRRRKLQLGSARRALASRATSTGGFVRAAGQRVKAAGAAFGGGVQRAGSSTAGSRKQVGELAKRVPPVARVRIAAAAIVAAVIAFVALVVIPSAPCSFPGGDSCPAPDEAIGLVPDDVLAYAHVDIDPEGEEFQAASELAERLPLLSRLAIGELAAIGGDPVDFESQVRPWAGGEVALAVLPGSGALERVVLIEADDSEEAQQFAAGILGTATTTEEVAGIEVTSATDGSAGALVDGFLVLGDSSAVADVIDPDGGETLESAAASTIIDELPDERVAYAYLSGEGARSLLGPQGSLAPFDTFVDSEASDGVAAALSAEDGLLELVVESRLDPELAKTSPPFFAALPPFEPTLPADVGSDALAYLGIGDPQASVQTLLSRAAAEAPDLLQAFNRAERDLARQGGVDLTEELLSLLGSEAAISVEPQVVEGSEPAPGTLTPSGVPYLSLLAKGVDPEGAARSLAALQEPLVDALAPAGSGRVGSFETLRIAGVDAQSLPVNPDVNLTYATFDDLLVVATNPIAVEQARAEVDGLEESPEFEAVTEQLPEEVSLLAYFDLRSLLALGEQIGLAADPAYATLAPDLRTLDTAALAVSRSDDGIRTDLRLAVGEPEVAEAPASPIAGE